MAIGLFLAMAGERIAKVTKAVMVGTKSPTTSNMPILEIPLAWNDCERTLRTT